jgi:hypothetical protein
MEAIFTFETVVTTYQNTLCHNPVNHSMNITAVKISNLHKGLMAKLYRVCVVEESCQGRAVISQASCAGNNQR